MIEHALTAAPEGADRADHDTPRPESPAIRLLEAMRAGDDEAVVAAIAQSTTVTAENLPWACRGPDEVGTMLREARDRFPGLTFEPTTRHVQFGLVIEEARVRDLAAETEAALAAEVDDAARAAEDELRAEAHPMWDEPAGVRTSELVLWSPEGQPALPLPPLPPLPLNLPVRVTVRHDDLQVHEVRLSFPAALLRRALGQYVDPLEMSLSEVQSAFIAPVGTGASTATMMAPEPDQALSTAPASGHAHVKLAEESGPRLRQVVPLVLMVLAVLAWVGYRTLG
jgi:FAD/FMN-containing dehydrogenase